MRAYGLDSGGPHGGISRRQFRRIAKRMGERFHAPTFAAWLAPSHRKRARRANRKHTQEGIEELELEKSWNTEGDCDCPFCMPSIHVEEGYSLAELQEVETSEGSGLYSGLMPPVPPPGHVSTCGA